MLGGGDGFRVLDTGESFNEADPGLMPSTNETILRALPMIVRPKGVTGVDFSLRKWKIKKLKRLIPGTHRYRNIGIRYSLETGRD